MNPSLAASSYAAFNTGGICALRSCIGLCGLLLLLSFVSDIASGQDLDETHQQREPIQAALVWDNLTCSPQYLSGVKPRRSLRFHASVVTLCPDEGVDFLVPAHELIRVVVCGKQTDGSDIQIWTSNGSGLYRKQNSAVSSDGCSVISAPDDSDLSVAKVWRPDTADGPITVAIYTSRRSAPQLLDYYQCPVLNCDDQVEISDDRGGGTRRYALLPGGASKQLIVKGPNRLRFETRLKYALDHQQRQTYWLRVYVDGVLDRVLSFDTLPQRVHRNFVDGCEQLVGRREFAYLDVDCGDKPVEIETSHPIYLRVDGVGLNLCRPNRNQRFEVPSWENPEKSISLWDAPQFDPSSSALSHWFLFDAGQSTEPPDPIWDPYLNQQTIQRLARNKQIHNGGLRAYMWMRALATRHYADADYGDEISVPELAERIRERYTVFRDLLPSDLGEQSEPRWVAFLDRKIRRPQEQATETIVGQQHIADALGWLPKTHLFDLPHGEPSKLVYRPPRSLGASLLRVVIDQSHLQQDTRLMVRFDDRPPIELVVHQDDDIRSCCLVPTRAEAALASLASVHARYDSGLVGGPYALCNEPISVVRAATAEFIKPADVSRIEVWLPSEATSRTNIGLQYLGSRNDPLSESSYLRLIEMETKLPGNIGTDNNATRFAWQELSNDMFDFAQALKSDLQNFSASIQRSEQLSPDEIWDSSLIQQKSVDAMALARTQQWPATIETLSEIINHSDGDTRRKAILARTNALDSAGEYFLADRERRGWLLFSDDPLLKRAMFDQLQVQAADDPQLQEMFSAVAVSENRDVQFQTQLVRSLINNGQYRNALQFQLSLDPNDRDLDTMLRCSFEAQWWQLFDRTVKQLPDSHQKNLWQGLKAMHLGQYPRAHRFLQSAGPDGAAWLKHWEAGNEIFKRLCHSNAATRLGAIGDWETWLTQYPGYKRWVEEKSVIKTSSGTATIYSASRDLRGQFYRATPSAPASIVMHGPVRIKIEARPIHRSGDTQAIDDWLLIENESQSDRLPITNNYESQTLTIDDDESKNPGQLVTAELELATGLNRIYLSAEQSEILFRVLSQRPELPLPVLPPINEVTMAAVIKGDFGKPLHTCQIQYTQGKDCVRLICRDRKCQSVPLSYLAMPCGCGELHSAIDYFNGLTFGAARDWEGRVIARDNPFRLASMDDDYRQAIELVHSIQRPSYYVEPEEKIRAIAALEELATRDPARNEIRRLLARARSGATWKSFLQFDSRAGVHSVEIDGWQPETPAIRIRKSLMAEHHAAGFVLTGTNDLVLQIDDDKPTDVSISLQRPQVSFVPMSTTIAVLTTSGQTQQVMLDDPQAAATLTARLASGPQRLDVHHGNPLANHFIAAEIQEIGPDGRLDSILPKRRNSSDKTRTYQVATYEEPIRFSVAAPKLLRIDKYENGYTISQTVPILEDQSLVLQPESGQQEMYRIFELEFSDPPLPTYRRPIVDEQPIEAWADGVVQAVYSEIDNAVNHDAIDLLSLRSPDLEPTRIELDDDVPLGLQELGTWGYEFGFQKRRALDEFPVVSSPGQFFDVKLFRNFYDQWRDRYTRNELIIRPRIGSGPTYGFVHSGATTSSRAKCRPNAKAEGWGPYDYDWNVFFYNQHAGTPLLENANSAPWSLGARGRISRSHQIGEFVNHRPSLTFFGRALSEDVNGFPGGELDQDIFTQYKSDHPYGLRLADRFIYQNCLDRRWWILPRLTSNADQLVPDNIGFQVGTDQLLGPLQVRLSYRLTGYFADNDRSQASVQNFLNLEWVYERWSSQICRNELRFAMQNDLNEGTASIGINLARVFNHARGYRDFEPESMLFRSIRDERAARHYSSGN